MHRADLFPLLAVFAQRDSKLVIVEKMVAVIWVENELDQLFGYWQ